MDTNDLIHTPLGRHISFGLFLFSDDAQMPENEFTFNSLAKIIKSKELAEAFKKQLKAL